MTSRLLGIASIALLAVAVPLRTVTAQASLPVAITLMVPVQVQDIDPKVVVIRVTCTAQPVGGTIGVTFDHHLFGDAGPVVNGAFSGTAEVKLTGTSAQPLPPGQQWSYHCQAEFVTAAHGPAGNVSFAPGGTGSGALAPTSGPNLVQGTFTTP
jgi:hypothetical protein